MNRPMTQPHEHSWVKVGETHDRDGDITGEVFNCTQCRATERRS